MSGQGWSRRRFMRGALCLAGGLAFPWRARAAGRGSPERRRAEALVATLPAPSAAVATGALYLAATPGERELGTLLGLLEEGGARGARGDRALARRLERMQRADFARERVVLLDGWLLSRTEARLYALAALVAA